MKKRTQPRKLQIAVESVRILDEVRLQDAAGGVAGISGITSPCGTTHTKQPGI